VRLGQSAAPSAWDRPCRAGCTWSYAGEPVALGSLPEQSGFGRTAGGGAGRPVAEVADVRISLHTIHTWRFQDRIDWGLEPGLRSGEHAELVAASRPVNHEPDRPPTDMRATLRLADEMTEPVCRRSPAHLVAVIGFCPLVANGRCPLTAISSRSVLAGGDGQLCRCCPRPALRGDAPRRYVRAFGDTGRPSCRARAVDLVASRDDFLTDESRRVWELSAGGTRPPRAHPAGGTT
jgi:hypothetical protein